MRKRVLFLCILLAHVLCLARMSLGQNGEFRPTARALGLGGSLVVQARDPSAIFWNPALLAGLKDRAFLLSSNRAFEFNLLSLTQFVPLYGTFGVALSQVPDTLNSVDRGTFAWGRMLTRAVALGGQVNVEKKKDDWFATAGWGIFLGNPMVGTLKRSWHDYTDSSWLDRFNLGLTFQNIPLSKKLFDLSALLGGSYLIPSLGLLFNAGYDIRKGDNTVHAGVGFELSRNLIIYGGIANFDADDVGVGLGYTYDNFIFNLAYSADLQRLLFTLSARISPDPADLAAPHFDRGVEYREAKQFKSADKEFRKYISYQVGGENTQLARTWVSEMQTRLARTRAKVDSLFRVARKLLNPRAPKFLRAAYIYTQILELQPENQIARARLATLRPLVTRNIHKFIEDGLYEFEAKRYEKAKKLFSRTLLLDKSNQTAQYYLSQIDQIYRDLAEEHFYRGVGYYRQKDYASAKREFKRALHYDPKSSEALSYLDRTDAKLEEGRQRVAELLQAGEKLENKRRYVEATNKYLEALQLDRDNLEAKARIARLRPKIERFVESKYREAEHLLRQERFAEAEQVFSNVLSIEPNHLGARRGLARVRARKKQVVSSYLREAETASARRDWQQALDLYLKILRLDPTNKQAKQAKAEVDKQIQVLARFREARNKFDAQDYVGAIEAYDEILSIQPHNEQAKAERSVAQIKLDDSIEKLFSEGINLYTQDRYEDAIRVWDEVLKIKPDHSGALQYKRQAQERLKALRKLN